MAEPVEKVQRRREVRHSPGVALEMECARCHRAPADCRCAVPRADGRAVRFDRDPHDDGATTGAE
jgi:hypothetical protein